MEFWNYTFHPVRMTDANLPGHTSLGTIKSSANHARPLFSFPPIREITFLSLTQDNSNSRQRKHHFNICSSASFRRPFPGQLFLHPKPNGPQSIWLSTKFLHSHLQLSSIFFSSRHKEKLPLKPSLNYKIENHQYQRLHNFISFF